MSNDHLEFLNTIIENPDDDAPRLAYADWLEENGDPERAEFIKLQIALAPYDPDMGEPKNPQPWQLRVRQNQVAYAMHEPESSWSGTNLTFWSQPIQTYLGMNGRWEFHRGFIDTIWIDWDTWLRMHTDLLRLVPLKDIHLTTQAYIALVGGTLRYYNQPYMHTTFATAETLRMNFGNGKLVFHLPELAPAWSPAQMPSLITHFSADALAAETEYQYQWYRHVGPGSDAEGDPGKPG